MKDANGREYRVKDIVFYGYGFSKPIVGIVYNIFKSGVGLKYPRLNGGWREMPRPYVIESTICKRPYAGIIVNNLFNESVFRTLFNWDIILDTIPLSEINIELAEIIKPKQEDLSEI